MLDEKGFTLTEIILAMAIFAIIAVMLMGTFLSGFTGITLAGQRSRVLREVQAAAEDLAARTFLTAQDVADYAATAGYSVSVGAVESRAGVNGFPVFVSRTFFSGRQTVSVNVFVVRGGG